MLSAPGAILDIQPENHQYLPLIAGQHFQLSNAAAALGTNNVPGRTPVEKGDPTSAFYQARPSAIYSSYTPILFGEGEIELCGPSGIQDNHFLTGIGLWGEYESTSYSSSIHDDANSENLLSETPITMGHISRYPQYHMTMPTFQPSCASLISSSDTFSWQTPSTNGLISAGDGLLFGGIDQNIIPVINADTWNLENWSHGDKFVPYTRRSYLAGSHNEKASQAATISDTHQYQAAVHSDFYIDDPLSTASNSIVSLGDSLRCYPESASHYQKSDAAYDTSAPAQGSISYEHDSRFLLESSAHPETHTELYQTSRIASLGSVARPGKKVDMRKAPISQALMGSSNVASKARGGRRGPMANDKAFVVSKKRKEKSVCIRCKQNRVSVGLPTLSVSRVSNMNSAQERLLVQGVLF